MPALQHQGAAGGMVAMFAAARPQLTEAEALGRLPEGTTIHEAGNGFITVALAAEGRAIDAFADFCWPFYVLGWFMGRKRFALRRENLGAFVERWEAWA